MKKPVTIVKEYVYCPRIAYFKMFSVYEPPTESMLYPKSCSLEIEQILEIIRQTLGDGYQVLVEVPVESRRIGVVGKVDAVAVNDLEAIPIEIKLNTSPEKLRRAALHHLAQCVAYCIAVEETIKKPVHRFLLVSLEPRAVYQVKIGTALREFIYRVAREIDRMVLEERIPIQTPFKKRCSVCFYKKMCSKL